METWVFFGILSWVNSCPILCSELTCSNCQRRDVPTASFETVSKTWTNLNNRYVTYIYIPEQARPVRATVII